MRLRWLLLVVVFVPAVSACSRGLTRDEAMSAISRNSLIRPSDTIAVDAISATSDSEAVVRASVGGQTTNLKLRRFDTGWTWEFVETKAGGWISPDIFLGEVHERERVQAAASWATKHSPAYTSSARTVWLVSVYHAPGPIERANPDRWRSWNKTALEIWRERPDGKDRVAVLSGGPILDAWNNEIAVDLVERSTDVVVRSSGLDKTPGTADDILCLVVFRRDFEDERLVWAKDRSWTVPEGLNVVVGEALGKRDSITFSRVVQP